MLLQFALIATIAAAPATPTGAKLVGKWMDGEVAFLELRPDGTGKVGEQDVKWTTDGQALALVAKEGEARKVTYRLVGELLVVDVEDETFILARNTAPKERPKTSQR
jgi:hypothetical protein